MGPFLQLWTLACKVFNVVIQIIEPSHHSTKQTCHCVDAFSLYPYLHILVDTQRTKTTDMVKYFFDLYWQSVLLGDWAVLRTHVTQASLLNVSSVQYTIYHALICKHCPISETQNLLFVPSPTRPYTLTRYDIMLNKIPVPHPQKYEYISLVQVSFSLLIPYEIWSRHTSRCVDKEHKRNITVHQNFIAGHDI